MLADQNCIAYPFSWTDKFKFDNTQAEQSLMVFFHKLLTMESSNIQNLLLHFIFYNMNLPLKAQEIELLLPKEVFGMSDDRSFVNKYLYGFIVEKYKLYKLK